MLAALLTRAASQRMSPTEGWPDSRNSVIARLTLLIRIAGSESSRLQEVADIALCPGPSGRHAASTPAVLAISTSDIKILVIATVVSTYLLQSALAGSLLQRPLPAQKTMDRFGVSPG
jgi:hypothetical protein